MKLIVYVLAGLFCLGSCQNFGDFMTEIRQSKARDRDALKFELETGTVKKLKQVYNELRLSDNAGTTLASSADLGASPYEVGSVCLNHTKLVINATINGETWAQRSKSCFIHYVKLVCLQTYINVISS